jgi:hypothetical protein
MADYDGFIDTRTDLASTDLRCNVGASGTGTETVSVTAGQSFTFTLDQAVYHQGPTSMYVLVPRRLTFCH